MEMRVSDPPPTFKDPIPSSAEGWDLTPPPRLGSAPVRHTSHPIAIGVTFAGVHIEEDLHLGVLEEWGRPFSGTWLTGFDPWPFRVPKQC